MSIEKLIHYTKEMNYDFHIEKSSRLTTGAFFDENLKHLFIEGKIDSTLYEIAKKNGYAYAIRIISDKSEYSFWCYADNFDDLITGVLLEMGIK